METTHFSFPTISLERQSLKRVEEEHFEKFQGVMLD